MSESSAKLRIVVDTNLFVSSAISPSGAPRRLLQAWYEGRFYVLFSDQQHAELIDVFERPKLKTLFRFTSDEFATFFSSLADAPRVEPSQSVPVPVRDPKDVPILAAALGGEADYLVTGDADLLALRDDPQIGPLRIMTVVEFLAMLSST